MTLTDKIAALPEWGWEGCDWHDAALARLALAREVIMDRVQIRSNEDLEEIHALLQALEPPK